MIFLATMESGQRRVTEVTAPTFEKNFDVIVCGLGTAGSLAALFAAENGLSVLGLEAFTCVGGNHTACGVISHYFGCPGGRYEQLEKEVNRFAQRYTIFTSESRKFLGEEALIEQGAELLYETAVCGVYLEDNTVIGVQVLTNAGTVSYGAKIVLDCTAEAYVAVLSGSDTEMGRATDGQMQPYSRVSLMRNGERYGYTNMDFGRVNQNDQWALSQAVLFSRSYKMTEGHAGRTLIAQMPLMGIREGRRIISEEQVRIEDLFAEKQTQTPMFYSYADLDKHGWDIAFDSADLGDWAIGANLGAYNVTVAVPYKAILPKKCDGLLVPCRALGVDRDISSCVRMNLDMKKLAEAAAQWATLAIQQNMPLREVPYAQLKERLEESGCLDEKYNRGYRVDGRVNWDGSPLNVRTVSWTTDPAELKTGLETQAPGEAIWAARRMGEKALPVLREYITAESESLQKHAAFAMAILGSSEANPVLRDMAIKRDGAMLGDCRKNNNLRGCMAIYWLGRLSDREIAPELMRLICDPAEQEKPVYQKGMQNTRYKIDDYDDTYFQFMSQSVMALVRIGDAHIDLRGQISEAFAKAFATDEYYHRITRKPKRSSEGNMVQTIKTVADNAAHRWQNM